MFKTRVLTAIVGVPALLFFVYLGGYFFGALVILLALTGLREYFTLLKKSGWEPVKSPGYIFLPLVFFAVFTYKYSLAISLWLLLFLLFTLLPVFFPSRISYWESAVSFWGIVYLGALSSFLIAIRLMPEGLYLTVILLALVWTTDIMAYLVGSSVGKRPLAKKISPKKTVEGTIGGIIGSSVSGMVLAGVMPVTMLTIASGGLLGAVIGGAGTLGDLTQSALKRSADVKDSGVFFPGHGGVLDRFDSLLFAAPFFYFYIKFFSL